MPSFAGVRRRLFPKPLVILLVVDIEQDSFILYFKFYGSLRVAAEDRTAAYVSLERHDLGKDRAVEQDGVAADALVGGDHDLRFGSAVADRRADRGFRGERMAGPPGR